MATKIEDVKKEENKEIVMTKEIIEELKKVDEGEPKEVKE